MAEHHVLMDGRLHIYKRENTRYWQCSTYLAEKNWRVSTKEESIALAKEFAEDWYLRLRGKKASGELKVGKTFKEAADRFLLEYPVMTAGQRNAQYVDEKGGKLRKHLLPFFGKKVLSEITPGLVSDYRLHRMQQMSKKGKPPARSTLHSEIVTLRQVLKTANRQGWLPYLPDLAAPYKANGKIAHRAWFSPEEYKSLYRATAQRIKEPLHSRHRHNRHMWAYMQMHDYVLFMGNTGLRPDEANRLEYRDVSIVEDAATKQTILVIEVRGKRGIGWCKSTPMAVRPFQRLLERNKPKPSDKVFPGDHRGLFNTILGELDLKVDRDGNQRTTYSLRHTYICFRLMEGADVWQLAKNCRTSVEMIEKFYAAHIKNRLDASAINVTKRRKDKIIDASELVL